jgi:cytochrome c biogenesis protein CcmG/thiol:disulfide interchange protein DsbE
VKAMRTRSGWGFWLAVVAGIAVVVFGVIFVRRMGTDITLTPSPLTNKQVPDVSIAYLDSDGAFRLSDFSGDIVVLNFWASWCDNCRAEHNALLAAASGYKDLGVDFVGVSYLDDEADSLAFLDELGRGDPYTYGLDEGSRVAVEFGVAGLPETFFIDADGIVRAKVSGPVSAGLLQRTLDAMILGEYVDPSVVTDQVENR